MGVLDLDILSGQARPCAIGRDVLPRLNSDEIDMIGQMLGDKRTNVHRLTKALCNAGMSTTENTVSRHLRGHCACPDGTELKGALG